MVRLDNEMCREVYSLLLLVPRGLPVLCLAARDLAQAGTQTGMTIRGLFTKPSKIRSSPYDGNEIKKDKDMHSANKL